MTEGEKKSLQQSLRETWMHALGVLSGAEAEVQKAAHRVLESLRIGHADQAEQSGQPGQPEAGGAGPPGAPSTASEEGGGEAGTALPDVKEVVREVFQRVQRNRAELERRLDEGVRAAIERVHRPFAQDVEQLRSRLDKLQRRVEDLSRRDRARGGKPPGHDPS